MANKTASKAQERAALERIQEIVADLGENSYLAAAFDGCFELAKENIDNDFLQSMKERAETAEEKAEQLELSLEKLCQKFAENNGEWQTVVENLKSKNQELAAKQLSPDDLTDCIQLVDAHLVFLDGERKAADAEVLELAESCSRPEFREAVAARKNALRNIEYYHALKNRLGMAMAHTVG